MAVYGALSEYPRATLGFTLDATPGRAATISITGLDDEWETLNPIALEVNGEAVYTGPSPFVNWDGIGNGANAAWTTVPFTIPSGMLRAGPNEIAFANLTPVASFNAPPYVLLADAILEISARATGETPTPTPVPIVPSLRRGCLHRGGLDWRVLSWRRSVLRAPVVGHLRRRERVPASDDSLQTRRAAKRSGDAHVDRTGRRTGRH